MKMYDEKIFEYAIRDSACGTIGYLIDQGFNVNKCYRFSVSNIDQSLLHLLSKLKDIKEEQLKQVARFLISRDANPNIMNSNRKTPLHQAVIENCLVLARVLIAASANLTLADETGMSPLHYAAQYGRTEFIDLLLSGKSPELQSELLKQASADGKTAIHWAAFQNNPSVMRKILFYGGDPNAKQEHDFTPLHYCAREGHIDCAAVLIEAGANVRVVNQNGVTPMTIAQGGNKDRHKELVGLLVDAEQKQLAHTSMGSHRRLQRSATIVKNLNPAAIKPSEFFTEKDKETLALEQVREQRNFNVHDQEYTDERSNQMEQVVEELALTLEQRKAKQQPREATTATTVVENDDIQIIEAMFNEAILQRKLLNYIEHHPNLLLFFNTIQVKLEELLIGFKSVASGMLVTANTEKAERAMMGISLLGSLVELVPVVGGAGATVMGVIEGFVKSYDLQQQNKRSKLNSLTLGTLKNFDSINFKVSSTLTLMFAAQLLALAEAPPKGNNSLAKFRIGKPAVSEAAIDKLPAVQVAEFIVLRMLDALHNNEIQYKSGASIEQQLINTVVTVSWMPSRWDKFKSKFDKLISSNIATNPSIMQEAWHFEDLLMKTAIVTMTPDSKMLSYYLPPGTDAKKYFYRILPHDSEQLKSLKISDSVVPITHVDYHATTDLFVRNNGFRQPRSTSQIHTFLFTKPSENKLLQDDNAKELAEMRSRLERLEKAVFKEDILLLPETNRPKSPMLPPKTVSVPSPTFPARK